MKKQIDLTFAVILSFVLVSGPAINSASSVRGVAVRSLGENLSRPPLPSLESSRRPKTLASPLSRASKPAQEKGPEGQSATLLPDARVLLIGGDSPDGPVATAAIKQPFNGETIPIANSLHHARSRHTATLLPDGKVFIFGGIDSSGSVLDNAEVFDPATQRFKVLTHTGLAARSAHSATVLTDGHVLIVGGISDNGKTLSKAELWDPETKSAITLPARLITARHDHTASILPDGKVLVRGGKDEHGGELFDSEAYDPEALRFIPMQRFTDQEDPNPPYLIASSPVDRDTSVPRDTRIVVRFSKPVRVETVDSINTVLTGPEGTVGVKAVPLEGGRLAFITPLESLQAATTYALSLAGYRDALDQILSPASFAFTTVGEEEHEHKPPRDHQHQSPGDLQMNPPGGVMDDERWIPDSKDPYNNWRSKGNESQWEKLPPLQAEPGVTAVAGRVLKLNGAPLVGVTLQIGTVATRTDSTGRFLLKQIAAGRQEMLINGHTASRPGKLYAMCENGVDVLTGITNVLPYTIWLPLIDTIHVTSIPSPTTKEVVVSSPLIPGLEMRIPAGVRLRTRSGELLTSMSLTAVPADRTPLPVPPGTQFFFTPQAHEAQIETVDGSKSIGIRIIYPNVTGLPAGSPVTLFDYDAMKGWYPYGEGTVTSDGKQVVPDPEVGLQKLNCTYHMTGPGAPAVAPPPCSCAVDGDPVDLATGLFVYRQTDLVLPDTIPISLSRTYRPNDSADRPFGKGATNPYDIYLWFSFWTSVDLVLPDGGKVRYDATPTGYEHTASPSTFYKSTLVANPAGGYDLKLKDGTIYHFIFKKVIDFTYSHYVRAPLEWIQDRNGNRLVIERDSTVDLRMTRIAAPNGRWMEFTYDGSSTRIAQARDNIGRTVNYTYDASGRLTQVTDPAGGVRQYTYDAAHRMLTIQDARGIVYLTNQYDANGRVTLQTQADSTTYQFAYTLDGSGKVTQTDITDARGNHRIVTFNSSGYPLTDTKGCSCGSGVTYERQAGTNLVTAMIDALSRRTEYAYDSMGNVSSVTRMAGTSEAVTTSFSYESSFNQIASVTDPLNHTSSFGYDSHGNLISVIDALNNQTAVAYNSAGQPTSVTDPLSNTIQFGYSGGDLASVTNPLSQTTSRFVDGAGRVVSVTNPLGQTARIEYDALNRTTRTSDPLQGVTQFSYDPNGNLLSLTDARNNVTSYVYDNMDRVQTRTDPLLHGESYQYQNGSLTQHTDRKGQITNYTYDALDRLATVTYADNSIITYTYDAVSRLTQMTDSISGTISYVYDNLDLLLSETTPQGTVSYTYDALGRRATMSVPGQAVVNYAYDNANGLTQITQGTSTVSFAYDNADRRTSLTLPNGVVTEYSYNAASQLISLTYRKAGTTLGDLTYQYDSGGQRIRIGGSYARTNLPAALSSASYNASNQQTGFGGQTLSYDLNGNLTGDGANTYTLNARDELVSIIGSVAAIFQYDAVGRRRSKTISGATTSFLYDGENVVQEQSSGTVNILAAGVDEFFTRSDAMGTSSLIVDALGSTVALVDSLGVVQSQYKYDPFGNAVVSGAASNNSSQYTGRENDGTGFFYYRARYYSPTRQRFSSEDPVGFMGGINQYAYVDNDSVNSTDPSGLERLHPQAGTWDGPVAPPLGGRKPLLDQLDDAANYAAQFWRRVGKEQSAKGNVSAAAAAGLLSELCGGPGGLDSPYLGAPIDTGMPISITGGGTRPPFSAYKRALREVHDEVGRLPKGSPGKFGSPQRGNSKMGYRLDSPHPKARPGTPECGYHINWWDYTAGKKGSGGRSGAVPIK